MKKIIYLFIITASLSISACKKKERPTLAPPESKIEGISATWVITQVNLTDEIDLLKTSRDITPFFIKSNPMEITFTKEGTYSVKEGDGKNYFGLSGAWSFDDPMYPTQLILDDGINWRAIKLLAPTRPSDPELKISIINKDCDDKAINSVKFTFKRK